MNCKVVVKMISALVNFPNISSCIQVTAAMDILKTYIESIISHWQAPPMVALSKGASAFYPEILKRHPFGSLAVGKAIFTPMQVGPDLEKGVL